MFWEETLLPRMSYDQGLTYAKFFMHIEGGKIWGEFDLSGVEELQEDFESRIEQASGLMKLGYPINMINNRVLTAKDILNIFIGFFVQTDAIAIHAF